MDLGTTGPGGALEELSLREAAQAYAIGLSTLRRLVRCGGVDAVKAPGAWGREWRVTRAALEQAGIGPRVVDVRAPAATGDDDRVADLERELAAARRTAAAARARAEEADRRLGEALLETGRLRAALARAGAEPADDVVAVVALDDLRAALVDVAGAPAPRRPVLPRPGTPATGGERPAVGR